VSVGKAHAGEPAAKAKTAVSTNALSAARLKRVSAKRPPSGAGTRPGGRAARVVDAILWATTAELARAGFDMLRVDDVALVAKVNKTTIYRRWPTKVDLVAAALRASHRDLAFMPNTGSVREDLIALLGAHVEKYKSIELRGISRAFLGPISSPELARLVQSLRAEYRERWNEVVRRGVAQGELPAGIRIDLVADLVSSLSSLRLIRGDDPLDAETRAAVVDLVLAGAKAAASTPKAAPRAKTRASAMGPRT
jgi:AcrR family transcriptional regulator